VVIDEAYADFSGVTLVPHIGKYPNRHRADVLQGCWAGGSATWSGDR